MLFVMPSASPIPLARYHPINCKTTPGLLIFTSTEVFLWKTPPNHNSAPTTRIIRNVINMYKPAVEPSSAMTFTPLRLEYSSTTAEQVDYQHYSRDHQQQVNQRATDMADQAQQPQNQQDHKNCPEHDTLLALLGFQISGRSFLGPFN